MIDYTELYNTLDFYGISYEGDNNDRDNAIKIILELKKRKAKKFNSVEITSEDIIDRYLCFGMDGIKTMFNRNHCYLYGNDFVYNILFYHYKREWKTIENIIVEKIKKNGTN
jgi:hypothetical protein